MCGFVGTMGQNSLASFSLLEKSVDSIGHRGSLSLQPQFYKSQMFCCGFSRLDICDLNDRANQPFFKEGYEHIMCFNGEIYNFQELKNELIKLGYTFGTTSDTEVVYYTYHHFGKECFKKLRGMFAIAIFHTKTQELLLARDHFGIKPLYYCIKHDKVYFSSEIKAFKNFLKFEVLKENIIEFLSLGINLDNTTLFKDIYSVLPGEILYFDSSLACKTTPFFSLLDTFNTSSSPDIDTIESILLKSIEKHIPTDVDYGTQLSGGLDSSFVTTICHKYNQNLQTFSVNFHIPTLDESYFQNMLTSQLGIHNHSFIYDDFFNIEFLKQSIYYEDFPLHHPNILASNKLNNLASKCGLKVLLSGDGADEVFCGYQWHLLQPQMIDNLSLALLNLAYVSPQLLSQTLNLPLKPINKTLIDETRKIQTDNMMTFLGQKIYLQKWLRRQDRSGMQNSLEIRVPFVDTHLIQALNSLDTKTKTQNLAQNKFILKLIAQKYMPYNLVYQQKIGFPIPIREWFSSSQSHMLLSLLQSDRAKDRHIYNNQQISHFINAHQSNQGDYSRLLWLLCNLELWLQVYID
ncbi:asparagine synthase (glutamine-hydrolyzing) [Helicobacter cinaedi]|uniref:asparagine synthase (glutamine-hydrolyzing) n=1 Tax=Helicobacter cinaedi TaxID=213 RepID=A0A377JRI2_9HELI|nr:asparagine synthase (glutamine-hydrolyzing) [Helicobacter cinaedi]STP09632.1 Asparagine synthetase [glutamine-hydrolyzing] 1 [Helicobacter cinaedi]